MAGSAGVVLAGGRSSRMGTAKAALEWHQEEPNKLIVRQNGQPHKVYTRAGGPYLSEVAQASSRLPSGHP